LLEFCRSDARNLVTLDLDFADLRFYPPRSHPGFIVVRAKQQDTASLISLMERLVSVLKERSVGGQLWIVEPDRIRYRDG